MDTHAQEEKTMTTPSATAPPLVPDASTPSGAITFITPALLSNLANCLDAGMTPSEVANELRIYASILAKEIPDRRSHPSSAGEAKCGRCGGTRWIEWMPSPKGMKDPSSPDDRARRAPCPDCTPITARSKDAIAPLPPQSAVDVLFKIQQELGDLSPHDYKADPGHCERVGERAYYLAENYLFENGYLMRDKDGALVQPINPPSTNSRR